MAKEQGEEASGGKFLRGDINGGTILAKCPSRILTKGRPRRLIYQRWEIRNLMDIRCQG